MKKHVIVNYKYDTDKLGSGWNGYKIVMLSDFHNNSYGVDASAVLSDINGIAPDCIIVAGDMYTGTPDYDNCEAEDFLEKLSRNNTVYYGLGNHEQRMGAYPEKYGGMYERFVRHIEKCGISLLVNRSVVIKRMTGEMEITGLAIDNSFYKKFKRVPMNDDYMEKTLGKPDSKRLQLLIAHNPVYFRQYAEWGADIIFSGHLHGGMAKLPMIGGIIAPNYRLFPKYDSGMYNEYGSTMILGAGIGTHTINIRPFNPAEIVVITINTCNK